jgi:tRNA (cytidine/uridine-2'-O-)-methyltransferase
MGFKVDDRKLKRAGLDYWYLLDITYYKDISEFFDIVSNGALKATDNTQNTSAAHAPPDTSAYNFHYFTTKARRVYSEPCYADNAYIFFGSETKGLSEELLIKNPEQCVRLPMLPGARSMNLANAVAVGVFEVLRQWSFPALQNHGKLAETS